MNELELILQFKPRIARILRILLSLSIQFLTAKICEMRETWDDTPFGIWRLEFSFSLGSKIHYSKFKRSALRKPFSSRPRDASSTFDFRPSDFRLPSFTIQAKLLVHYLIFSGILTIM